MWFLTYPLEATNFIDKWTYDCFKHDLNMYIVWPVLFSPLHLYIGDLRIDTFYYYSSKRANALLVGVASHGVRTGFEVPCLIVAAKADLDSFPMVIQNSIRVFFFFSDYNIICMFYYASSIIHKLFLVCLVVCLFQT